MIFKPSFIAHVATAFIFLAISTCPMSKSDQSTISFTVDLIHRDSPKSPIYDSSLPHSQRLVNALRRSFNRVNRFKGGKNPTPLPETSVTNSNGEYLMKYSIGSPPVSSLGIADTGSDITWTQCLPCLKCFNQTLPKFDPKKSTTYKRIPCNTSSCTDFLQTFCSKTRKNCLYSESYGDGSSTDGELSMDTITLGSSTNGRTISFPNITLGCGFSNGGIFTGGESGIVGLGPGKASLIRQLGGSIGGKFSYCLVPLSGTVNSSKLNFGANADVSGRGVVSTPLVSENYYILTLEGITVGKQHLDFYEPSDSKAEQGNIIIDSGTTLTLLPLNLYDKVVNVVKGIVKLKQVPDPQGVLDLCYFTRNDIRKPEKITFNFKGANVDLKPENYFVRLSDTLQCLAFQAGDSPIFGNLAQNNFLVGYDLQKGTVSFKAVDCTKF